MFRQVSAVIACLAAGALLLQGSRTSRRAGPESRETPETIRATILELEQRLDEAESQHRVAAVADLIADDYSGITVGGGVIGKRDVLAAVAGKEETSSRSSNREVRPLENAAVYTALVRDQGIDPKTQEPYLLTSRVTDIWQKRGRQWKLINDQATGVALDQAAQ